MYREFESHLFRQISISSSIGRATALQAEGYGFNSHVYPPKFIAGYVSGQTTSLISWRTLVRIQPYATIFAIRK